MRDIVQARCSCGGLVEERETTADEDKEFGCGYKGCCSTAFVCVKCNTRFVLEFDAPEAEEW